jgi:hypothetical protein
LLAIALSGSTDASARSAASAFGDLERACERWASADDNGAAALDEAFATLSAHCELRWRG